MRYILQKGRPEDESGRLEREILTYDLLESKGIFFERVDHEAMATIEDCMEVDKILEVEICKNLFLCNSNKTKFFLLMIPGSKKFKTKDLSAQLGTSRLSFAKSEHMEELLGLTPGSVSVMGLMNDRDNRVQLIIDKEVLEQEYIACHPCMNTFSLRIRTEDVIKKLLPAIGHEAILAAL